MAPFPRVESAGVRGAGAVAREQLRLVSRKKNVWPTIQISRRQILERVEQAWPDKRLVAATLANEADRLIMGFPESSRQAIFSIVASFGARIGAAIRPELCVDEFVDLVNKLACPEPGFEAATIEVEE